MFLLSSDSSFPIQQFIQMLNLCREEGGKLIPLWCLMYFWWHYQTCLHFGCLCHADQSKLSINLTAKPSLSSLLPPQTQVTAWGGERGRADSKLNTALLLCQ